jgi:hypothetical protein
MGKKCAACRRRLSYSNFHTDLRRPDKLYSSCKKCSRAATRKYYERNSEKCNASARKWYRKNKKYVKEYSKQYRLRNFKKRKLSAIEAGEGQI